MRSPSARASVVIPQNAFSNNSNLMSVPGEPESRASRSLDVEGELKSQLYAPDNMLVPQGSPNKIHACIDDSFYTRSGAQQLQNEATAAVAAVTPRQRRHSYEVQPVPAKTVANKTVDEQLRRQRRHTHTHTFHTLPAERPPATSKSRSQPPSASSPSVRRETPGNPHRGSPNQARSLASSPQLRRTICSSSAAISASISSSTSPSPKPQARSLGGAGSAGGSLSGSPKPAAERRSSSVGGTAKATCTPTRPPGIPQRRIGSMQWQSPQASKTDGGGGGSAQAGGRRAAAKKPGPAAGGGSGGDAADAFPVCLARRRASVCCPVARPIASPTATPSGEAHLSAAARLVAPDAAPSYELVSRLCARRYSEPSPSRLSPGAIARAMVPPLRGLRYWSEAALLSDDEAEAEEAEADALEETEAGAEAEAAAFAHFESRLSAISHGLMGGSSGAEALRQRELPTEEEHAAAAVLSYTEHGSPLFTKTIARKMAERDAALDDQATPHLTV